MASNTVSGNTVPGITVSGNTPSADGSNIVRAAITQTKWTGDKGSMLDKHEGFAREAAAGGAQVICFQE
ncbi:MAG: hypothetical protein ABI310_10275, partial [Microbacteriaceae bacterium]